MCTRMYVHVYAWLQVRMCLCGVRHTYVCSAVCLLADDDSGVTRTAHLSSVPCMLIVVHVVHVNCVGEGKCHPSCCYLPVPLCVRHVPLSYLLTDMLCTARSADCLVLNFIVTILFHA